MTICLVGVNSARAPIGATVRMSAGGRSRLRQLTAGDGYQCSNERTLVFGLGEQTTVEELSVSWPSGHNQVAADLAAGRNYVFIEGRSEPLVVPAGLTAD